VRFKVVLTTKEILQYILIFLVVLWPVWVLAFVFLRLLVLKIGSLFKGRKEEDRIERPAVPSVIVPPKPVEKLIGA
jgi:hypothetical protein